MERRVHLVKNQRDQADSRKLENRFSLLSLQTPLNAWNRESKTMTNEPVTLLQWLAFYLKPINQMNIWLSLMVIAIFMYVIIRKALEWLSYKIWPVIWPTEEEIKVEPEINEPELNETDDT